MAMAVWRPLIHPVPLIAAAALALEGSEQGWAGTDSVTEHLRARVSATIPDVTVAGDIHHRVPYLTLFSMLYAAADEMVDALGRRGWAVSSGASCASDTHRPHHVLVAVGALTHGSLRVSVGPTTTTGEIDDFVTDLARVVAAARADAGAAGCDHSPAITVDARGLLCPQPVLLLARVARAHPGVRIEVLADDPAAATDIPAWCGMRGAQLIAATQAGEVTTYVVLAAEAHPTAAGPPHARE